MKKPRHEGRGLIHHNLAPAIVSNSPPLQQTATQEPTRLKVSDDWLRACKASRSPDDSLTVALQRANLKRRANRASVLKVVR